jgi:hypothetical protein
MPPSRRELGKPQRCDRSYFSSSTVTEMEIFGSEFSPNTHKLPN